jgi:hypothetical protein
MPRPLASLTVLALASAFACSSPSQPATPLQPEAPVAQERCASPDELRVYTVPSGAILRGRVEFDHLWIEPGATVCVASDLELVVGGVARIDGTLVALDGLNGEQRKGPRARRARTAATDRTSSSPAAWRSRSAARCAEAEAPTWTSAAAAVAAASRWTRRL